jgi:zinc protease
MNSQLMTRNWAVYAATFAIAGGIALRADDALPKAETILDRYIEVTGGKAAYEKHKTEVQTGAIEVPAQGMKGTFTHYATDADKVYIVMELEGMGKIEEEGVSDGVAWQTSPMTGAHVKTGVEKAQAMREATFNEPLNWRKMFTKVETTGTETINGEECYKVVLTPAEGKPETSYYSKKTGLLVRTLATMESAMGEMEAESTASAYKDFGGVLMPTKVIQKAGTQEMIMTVTSVKVNESIPPEKFAIPPDVKALMNKPAAK